MFLLGFARLTRTSTFTSLAVCTAHVNGGKRLPPSRANTANSAIIRRENRLTRGVLWTRHKFSSSLRRKRPAPMAGTAGYRSLRSLCACLAVFNFEIKGVNTDARHRGWALPPTRLCLPLFLVHQLKGEKGKAVASRGLKWGLHPASAGKGSRPSRRFSRTTVSAPRPSSRRCSLRQSAEP